MSDEAPKLRRQSIEWCYQQLRWSFVPLNGKKPRQQLWQQRPRETLAEALQWAQLGNVGVRTGQASGGLVVIDVDPGGDASALALPPTVTVITGSQGRHYYFRSDTPLRNSAGRLAEHIDVRGEGGQVVFVGSIHPDTKRPYQWLEGHEPWNMALAPLPTSILDRLKPKERAFRRPRSARRQLGESRLAEFILRSEVQSVVQAPEGTRNQTLNTAAFTLGRLVGGGHLRRTDVEAELRAAAVAAGLAEPEIGRTIASGLDAGIKDPRQLADEASAPRAARCGKRPTARDGDDASPASGAIPLGQRHPDTGRLVLSPRRTLPTARAFVEQFHTHPDGRTIHCYAGLFLGWRDNRYVELEDESLRHRLQPWLHDALRYVVNRQTGEPELVDFDSNPGTVNAALDSIRSYVHLPATVSMPSWLEGHAAPCDAREVLPCRTMNLHIPTGQVMPATPALFAGNALDFDYDPAAAAPRTWIQFLKQLWGLDIQQIHTLQEWFGYCLTADTSQQKILLIIGPRRSGKGTIGRVLTRLVGGCNVVGPTTASLAGAFGLQPLIGKSLAIVSDARFSGDSIAIVVERLLCISGEDMLTIDRKFLPAVSMKLPTRLMLLTNELPRMSDASGALAGRFIVLRLSESFYGREDTKLTERLTAELPGILLWAIEGWKRLRERGHFIQPQSVSDAVQEMEDLTSPVAAFVRERCRVGAGERCYVSELYAAWKTWCQSSGRDHPGTVQTFSRDLLAAVPGLRTRRNNDYGRFYEGISHAPGL
ncbi:phage/plasmid primase, P4 family [Fontivita pretiosa]|uniref:phage/plasmid primase, P4 family n=1 Tax=Fontivita pretiosa TaxID=2989684 RepID=UPI003D179105